MGILTLYGRLAARPALLPLNHALLKFVARGLGYGLFGSPAETGERWFIREVLARHDPKVCFDIGANIGGYSRELLANTNAIVHAFEPIEVSHSTLSALAATEPRLLTHQFALGDNDRVAQMIVDPSFTQTASLLPQIVDMTPRKSYGEKRTENVVVRTIDNFCQSEKINRLDFIKIDSEGCELEVLSGAQETLRALKPKFIQFEFANYHLFRRHMLADLAELLPSYRIHRLLRSAMVPVDLLRPADNLYLMANYIAVRADF